MISDPSSPNTTALSHRKQTIARHFAYATDYDDHAYVQQQTCQLLSDRVATSSQHSVLEVGAGSGMLTKRLANSISSAHWYINELSAHQAPDLQALLPQARIIIGDAETLDLGEAHSLIISGSAVQWFDKPLNFVIQSSKRLRSGGQLLFSTFTPDNFRQIKALTGQGLTYPALPEWRETLKRAGLKKINLTTHRFDLRFTSPLDVLRHMQATGVSTNQTMPVSKNSKSSSPFRWTKTSLKQFERRYWQEFAGQDSSGAPDVYLTYDVLIISAFKD